MQYSVGGYALLPTERVPFHANTTHLVTSFAVAGPRVWNSLPTDLRDEDITYNSFRRELKTVVLTLLPGCNATFVNCAI